MDMRPDQTMVRVRDLVVGFGQQIVLDHLDLDVRRGEILGIVGASGSGKSVLLRTIIGLLPKRAGSIVVAGSHFKDAASASDHDASSVTQHWASCFSRARCSPP